MLDARKSKIKMWANLISDQGPLPGLRGMGRRKISLLITPITPFGLAPTVMTLFNHSYLLKTQSLDTVTLGVDWDFKLEFWGDRIQSIALGKHRL